MADLFRIKQNVAKMASMQAPEEDIDGYIASEGVSVDDVKNYQPKASEAITSMVNQGLQGVGKFITKPTAPEGGIANKVISTALSPTIGLPRGIKAPNPLSPPGLMLPPMANQQDTAKMVEAQSTPLVMGLSALPFVEEGKSLAGLAKTAFTPAEETSAGLLSKAHKLTTEVLNPPVGELAGYKEVGKVMPAVEEAAKELGEVKTYGEAQKKIEDTISKVMGERDTLIKEPKLIGDYTKGLEDEIARTKQMGQATPAEIKQMEDTLLREKNWMKNNPITREGLQGRKEELQRMTDTVLQKNAVGEYVQPSRKMALDIVRRGIKESIEAGDQKVADLNARYGGLQRAKKLLARQGALADKAIPESALKKVISAITHPKRTIMEEALTEEALTRQGRLAGTTRKIANIRAKIK